MSGFIAEFEFAPKAVAFVLAGRFWGHASLVGSIAIQAHQQLIPNKG